jgi:MFS family permease
MDNRNNPAPQRTTALPGARIMMTVLVILNLLNYFDRQILPAVLPLIKADFFVPGAQHGWFVDHLLAIIGWFIGAANPEYAVLGLLNVAFVASYAACALIFATLRWPRWRLIGTAAALWSVATGLCGAAGSFGSLLFRRALVGVGEAGYGPVAPVMIADYFPPARISSVLSFFYAMTPLGAAMGLIYAGNVAASLGWRWSFFLPVIPGLLLALLCFTVMKEPKLGAAVSQSDAPAEGLEVMSWSEALPRLLRNRSYVLCTLGMTGMMFALGGIAFWIPEYLYSVRHAGSLEGVNTIFGLILVVAGIGGTLLGGKVGDMMRTRIRGSYFTVSAVAMFVGFICFVAFVKVTDLPLPIMWLMLALVCVGLFFNTGPTNAVLINVTEPSLRQKANALNILIIHAFGDVLSPFVIGAIADRTGSMDTAFFFASMTVLVGGLFWQLGARYLAADTARITGDSNGK